MRFESDRDTLLFGSYADVQTDGWEYTKVDAYTRLDANLVKGVDWGVTRAEFAFILQNLTGSRYNEFRPDFVFEKPGSVFDRRAFLQVSVQWPPFGP